MIDIVKEIMANIKIIDDVKIMPWTSTLAKVKIIKVGHGMMERMKK